MNHIQPDAVEALKFHKYSIEDSRKFRQSLLDAIVICDKEAALKFIEVYNLGIQDNGLNLLNRIPGNPVESLKLVLHANDALYQYFAEKGGMDPVLTHFLSEKNTHMIQAGTTVHHLLEVHEIMLLEYINPENREWFKEKGELASQAMYFIQSHYMKEINVDTIADYLKVSKFQLMKEFKELTGKTINHTITEIRIKEAKNLLGYSDMSITDISFFVGFNSSQYFSTVFRKTSGLTPSEFIAQKRNKRLQN